MTVQAIGDSNDDGEIQLNELGGDDGFFKQGAGREGEWTNLLTKPIKLPIVARVPEKILLMMRTLEHRMQGTPLGGMEFGAYLKGSIDQYGRLCVEEDFYVPEQEVTGAAIDFNEDTPDDTWNGVIHRHPSGCRSFSGVDDEFINSNFHFSLLYVNNDITIGIVNLPVAGGDTRIQIACKCEVTYPVFTADFSEMIDKIDKAAPPPRAAGYGSMQRGGYHNGAQNLLPAGDLDTDIAQFMNLHDNDDDDDEEELDDDPASLMVCKGLDCEHVCKTCGDLIEVKEEFPCACPCNSLILTDDQVLKVDDLDDEERESLNIVTEEEFEEKMEEFQAMIAGVDNSEKEDDDQSELPFLTGDDEEEEEELPDGVTALT